MQVQAVGLVLLINRRLYLETEEPRRREKQGILIFSSRQFTLIIILNPEPTLFFKFFFPNG